MKAKEGAGGSENPLYIAWLAGYPSGTASHFLSTSHSFPLLLLLLFPLHLFSPQKAKWVQNQKVSAGLRLDKTPD